METIDWNKLNQAQNKLEAKLKKDDAEAKAQGTLVGRYITEPVADGSAVYKVIKVTKTKAHLKYAHLKHVALGDCYQSNIIEQMGCKVPLKYVQSNVGFRDNLAKVFGK